MLQFCLSQNPNQPPFAFVATGIRCTSFEEVLHHAYHYWRESVDELLSDRMVAWVGELGLSYIAAKMKDLTRTEPYSARLLAFLRLIDYFDESELAGLSANLATWERRRDWEKLKERADHFLTRSEATKAVPLYRRALQYEQNIPLLNNLAIACMQLGNYREAAGHLAQARALDSNDVSLMLHHAEAAILCGEYAHGQQSLRQAQTALTRHGGPPTVNSDIPYLHGLVAYEQADYPTALTYFTQARKEGPQVPLYAYKMADTYTRMRKYDDALAVLSAMPPPQNADFYTKQAEVYAAYGNLPAAIRSISQAIHEATEKSETAPVGLWVRLAGYFRQDYDLERANTAISRALAIDPDHNPARLENARIKKGLGRTREYQAVLTDVLKGFKQRYREEV